MRIYIAGPLFNEMELERNRRIRDALIGWGYKAYLPQEDGGVSYNLIAQGASVAETRHKIFEHDFDEIKKCDAILCLLDGRTVDEGLCIELGAAYALGKRCIGYLTDQRSLDKYGASLMIDGCLSGIAHSLDELKEVLAAK